jgi:tellurium resistance protein TerZ
VNWGAIEKKGGFLGFGKSVTQVDLDLSCVMIDTAGQVSDHLYSPDYKPDFLAKFGLPPGKLLSRNNALRHSGDDRAGDSGGDDGLDNEVITVNLAAVEPNISQIFFFLNNVGQEDFSMIPYAKIRMYEGTPTKVKEVFADYNVAAEAQYAGKKALIMGKLYKKDNEWKFNAIGDPTEDVFLGQTIHRIVKSYL